MRAFLDHTKCPPSFVEGITCSAGSGEEGFFKFSEVQVFGRAETGAGKEVSFGGNGSAPSLPFDPTEVIENLRLEKYVPAVNSHIGYISNQKSISRRVYYALRPLFPVGFRRILQRRALQDWAKIPFPRWPVDTTVEDVINRLWLLVLNASGETQIPFIWYWPKGFDSCAIMTHDVETGAGQDFCYRMLEMEREYGVRSSFELVPEVRYKISNKLVDAIRAAGSEVCIHGLKHDGRLFSSEEEFRRRARLINEYAREYGATGFRSPVMYRNPAWYNAFEFSYDMSFPNVAHLDPQRGGCCTVFPYFIGRILELPLTTTQDYPLYNILRSDPLEMWTKQMELILARHGLGSFIIHPDYTFEPEKQRLYQQLLGMLQRYQQERNVWLALPREVDQWWRERSQMSLVRRNGGWEIQGKGAERASVAYATAAGDRVDFVQEPELV